MSLVFKTIQTEGIAELSYLVGDDDEGVAAAFDPRADCDVYIEAARHAGVIITHIFETHIHADLISGSRELCARLETAKIYASGEGGAEYGFNPEKIKDGDRFEFGEVIVTARHTPGHTPEHMSYLLSEADHPEEPWAVLTRDSLFVSSAALPVLWYYPLMKKVFAEGPNVLGSLPRGVGLCPKAFKDAIEKEVGILVDVRNMLAFGGGHITGALNIAGTPILSIWAGWLLDPEKPILLVLEEDDDLEKILRLFVRTGYTKFTGYLIGGMKAWHGSGFPFERIGQMSVHELNERKSSLQVVHVRSPGAWQKGHIPGAHHIFTPELGNRASELDRNKPTAIYCGSGYRSSIATSI